MASDGSIVNPDATVIRENTTGAVIYDAETATRHEVPGDIRIAADQYAVGSVSVDLYIATQVSIRGVHNEQAIQVVVGDRCRPAQFEVRRVKKAHPLY